MTHPLRTVLFLPASNARAIDKARGLDVGAVILDLEDAVGPDDKAHARALAVEAVRERGFRSPVLAVRVNGEGTEWADEDLAAMTAARPDVVLVPKADGPDSLAAARARLGGGVRLWANIETCQGVLNLRYIAREARPLGVEALVFGQNDLSKEMGFRIGLDRTPLYAAMSLTVTAARAGGMAAIDGVYNVFGDEAGLKSQSAEARRFGFDGKACIHPAQLETVAAAFAPDAADIAWARAVVAAFADPSNAGKGAVRVEGGMAERLHLEQAERILALGQDR